MKASLKIHNQQGFTFLESLLALFILSIGLLGVAGMHSNALQTGFSASQRMAAVMKGEELLERMRANPQGVADNAYAGTATSYGCTSGNTCTTSEMAQDDMFIWRAEINSMFPSSTIQVLNGTLPAAIDPNGQITEVTISIDWTSRNISYNYTTVAEIGL